MKKIKFASEKKTTGIFALIKHGSFLGNLVSFFPRIYFGKYLSRVAEHSLVFFPCRTSVFYCGLAGIVAFKRRKPENNPAIVLSIEQYIETISDKDYRSCKKNSLDIGHYYLGGDESVIRFLNSVRSLKTMDAAYSIYTGGDLRRKLVQLARELKNFIDREDLFLKQEMGYLESSLAEIIAARLDRIRDAQWCLDSEILEGMKKIKSFVSFHDSFPSYFVFMLYKQLNAALSSLDRLEVRGRDSAGISMMFTMERSDFEMLHQLLEKRGLESELSRRLNCKHLLNNSIQVNDSGDDVVSMAFTYKYASVIGCLGENGKSLRQTIADDRILYALATLQNVRYTIFAHTRWASVGEISEYNCHPLDNACKDESSTRAIIHVCLNGDIDNYQELKKNLEKEGNQIHHEITTDTKIIPLQVEKHLRSGVDIVEAFRLAVNDFQGAHAIVMHTDLAPGKLFLAQKGSGQAIFTGLGPDYYMATSEVYGFVEETDQYVKIEGDKRVDGDRKGIKGRIYILDHDSPGGLEGIFAMSYSGDPIHLDAKEIKRTEITTRDIDRQHFPHYFLKEISEAPVSVEKTLQNRWKIKTENPSRYVINLNEKTVPRALENALTRGDIQRIFFIGQGTAGVAALASAGILEYYLRDPLLPVLALKASELSGAKLNKDDHPNAMADTLVIAISQSGTTTDTNRAVDMVKERGAYTVAIVNRRDSDLTFKADGVLYTSNGRDIEMSVASTKAFYSQIVAGALLGLHIAAIKQKRDEAFISREIEQLLAIPDLMRKTISLTGSIEVSARRLAGSRTYWAAVGSGMNKASADEIRIKLSELCYKTISSDYIEDKKHIDLSSEPLIMVCAAGSRESIIGDIVKDVAIFKAHKAVPLVIADEGESRFDPYAEDVFHVPRVAEHFAPVINTLVGHIWGYYAALAIDECGRFLQTFRKDVQLAVKNLENQGLTLYEMVLENSFREKMGFYYNEFRKRRTDGLLPSIMSPGLALDFTLLLKYLSGRLPAVDFEIDFGKKGTASNMMDALFSCLGESINDLMRPVDAIKHQAKTVTVGTSRISETLKGVVFDYLEQCQIKISQITPSNAVVLKNIQPIVASINGSILYQINGLNLLGEVTESTTIEVVRKHGMLRSLHSRVENDPTLKGTKQIIVKRGNVYIGKGRKDDRNLLVIPIQSPSFYSSSLQYLLLINISFKKTVLLNVKIKALGGKYDHIKNIVQETGLPWDDQVLETLEVEKLFGWSAEKVAELIAANRMSVNSEEKFGAVVSLF